MNKIHNFQSTLLKKEWLTLDVCKLELTLPNDFNFNPGQFVGARVIPTHTRAYSIAEVKNNILTLLVDIKPGGKASKYFENIKEGEITNLLGPYGVFGYKNTNFNKVFISTGTGIAPFIAMITDLNNKGFEGSITNFFGSKTLKDDFTIEFFKDLKNINFKHINCITREDINNLSSKEEFIEYKFGRVNSVIKNYTFNFLNTEFYICGASQMIADTIESLKEMGADKIYIEKY